MIADRNFAYLVNTVMIITTKSEFVFTAIVYLGVIFLGGGANSW